MAKSLFVFAVCPRDWPRLRSRGGVKKGEVEAHAPVGAVARGVCIIFPAYLNADRLLPNLQDLANLENNRYGPFSVGRRGVPVRGGFGTESKSRMRLSGVGEEGLQKHLAKALRSSWMATDQSWFISAPAVNPPICLSTTTVGPIENVPVPRSG